MSPKVNGSVHFEFKLAYYDVAVKHGSHDTVGIPSWKNLKRNQSLVE